MQNSFSSFLSEDELPRVWKEFDRFEMNIKSLLYEQIVFDIYRTQKIDIQKAFLAL